jgi:hypothetical protein
VPLKTRRLKSKKLPTAVRAARTAKELRAKRKARFAEAKTPAPIYWPDHVDEVKAIAMTGMTDDEMAQALGVKPELWESWRQFYPSFSKAIEDGRTRADANVVAALYQNAVGYEYEADEVVRTRKGAQVLTVTKKFLPETGAQKFWLTNRKPEWRAGQQVNLGGQKGNPVQVQAETKAMVIHSILNMIQPQPDDSSKR